LKLALIEDESLTREMLYKLLKNEYEVKSFENLEQFLKTEEKFDIIIGDINLPDGNLLEKLLKFPNITENSLLIIISGDGTIENIKKSFEIGAVDFLKKPFEFEELIIRIERFIKNKKKIKLATNIYYNPLNKTIITDNKTVELTFKESKFLELLIEKKGIFVSFEEIERKVWGEPIFPNTLAALVKRLRKKLGKDLIESKRLLGYKLKMSS